MIMIIELLLAQIVHSKSKDQKVYLPDFSELDIWTMRAQLAMMLYNNKRCYSTLRNLAFQMINSVKKPVSEQKENIGKEEGVVKVSISNKPTQFSLTDSTLGHHKNLNDNQWEIVSAKRSVPHRESHTASSPPLQPFPNPPVSSGCLLDMSAYPPLPAVSFVSSGDSDGMNVSKSTNFASQPDFALNWIRAKSPLIT
ncbi:hypothetical protein J6590_060594 [Homalodisca vitripennis]|nr:hypothetical protein J6590_060594 [Homalodisca vitripennis]